MLNGSELLFGGGIIAMAVSAVAALAALIVFLVSGKRLRARLDAEYGRRRH